MMTKILKSSLAISLLVTTVFATSDYDKTPPFKMDKLEKVTVKGAELFQSTSDYSMFVNYELGMHCVGFDMSYCCVIPPYNSIQAQAFKIGKKGTLPKLLSPKDNVKVFAYTRDNSFSEGNKMKYWTVAKDADGDGHLDSPGDNVANYVWTHLFIYKDLEGTMPRGATDKDRLRIGRDIPVKVDHGPSGAPMTGYMTYAGKEGGNIVFVDTLVPEVKNVKITLTASHLWDSLGLPLTAFNDSTRRGSLRAVTEKDFQPCRYT